MLPVDDIGIAIADVYAKALLKLAGDAGAQSSILEELGGLVVYVNTNGDFESFLTRAAVDAEARRATIEKSMRGRASDMLVDFLQVLNRKDRLALLEQIYVQYRLAYEASQSQVEVTATTAAPLSAGIRESLVAALRNHTGKEPILTEQVDASLIGGMVVHIGDLKIDFSVAKRLRNYRSAFLARASLEIQGDREYFEVT